MIDAIPPRRLLSSALCGLLVPLGGIGLVGCVGEKPAEPVPLELPPELTLKTVHFAGTPLSGTLGPEALSKVESEPARALALHAEILLLDALGRVDPAVKGHAEPTVLVDALEVVVDPQSGQTISATSRLAGSGIVVTGASALDVFATLAAAAPTGAREIAEGNEVVLPGATTRIEVTSGTESRLAIAVHGKDAMHARATLELTTPGAGSEILKLAEPIDAPESVLIALPSPFDRGSARGCALLIELAPAPDEGDAAASHAAAVARAFADVKRASEELVRNSSTPSAGEDTAVEALRQLTAEAPARSCLVQLGAAAQSPLVGDLALVASNDAIAVLLKQLVDAKAALLEQAGTPATFTYALEREAWRFLVTLALDTDLEPEMTALLYRHAGGVGAWPSTLQDVIARSTDRDAFQNSLIKENVLLLSDHNASVRVRAYDWLSARRAAPEGFDPLAPLSQRRDALNKLAAKEENGG